MQLINQQKGMQHKEPTIYDEKGLNLQIRT